MEYLYSLVKISVLTLLCSCVAVNVKEQNPQKVKHIYVIHGRSGQITPDQGESPKCTLELHDIDHSIVYFSSLPNRQAGTVSMKDYLEQWSTEASFGKAPPPGELVYVEQGKEGHQTLALTLQHPRYNEQGETLTFKVEGFEKPLKTIKFSEATLFLEHE